MERICRHAFKISEMWRGNNPRPTDHAPPHIIGEDERMRYSGWEKVVNIDDSLDNWQCGWGREHDMPVPLARLAGGNYLRSGDCDACKFFGPVDVKIPGVKPST